MGLKKNNYTIEKIGITVPEAYAVIRNISIYGEKGSAEFVIQTSRERALNEDFLPLETIYVNFDVNRNENAYDTAYTVAKGVDVIHYEVNEVETPRFFHDWEDDIVE